MTLIASEPHEAQPQRVADDRYRAQAHHGGGLISVRRSTAGATAKSIVIPGQPSAGMGPWVRLVLCPDASTALTVPVPCAWPCPACAIRISAEAAAVRGRV